MSERQPRRRIAPSVEPRGPAWRCYLTLGAAPEPWFLPVEERLGLVVGRGSAADLQLSDSHVSRRHCRIVLEDGVYHVEDLGSARGTLRNGKPVRGRQRLVAGDILTVVSHRLQFHSLADEIGVLCKELANDRLLSEIPAIGVGASKQGAGSVDAPRGLVAVPVLVTALALFCIVWLSRVVWGA